MRAGCSLGQNLGKNWKGFAAIGKEDYKGGYQVLGLRLVPALYLRLDSRLMIKEQQAVSWCPKH